MDDLERAIQVLDFENYYDNALMGWKRESQMVEAMIAKDRWESGWELVASIVPPVGHDFVRGYLRAFHRWGRVRLDPAPRGRIPAWGPRYKSECEMQRSFRRDITLLEEGLQIIDGGKEIVLDTGRRPDIVARDAKGNIVITELKLETAGGGSIGQILAYMAVYAAQSKRVRGLIVANRFDDIACAAATLIPNLQLRDRHGYVPLPWRRLRPPLRSS